MADPRRLGLLAITLLVVVRLAIGWQLLYEGMWKLHTQTSSQPWTAEPYLKNAQWPLRSYFRNLTGDPDDLNWLDQQRVQARLDDWVARFSAHYQLSDAQRVSLARLVVGPADFRVPLEQLPPGVAIPENLSKTVRFDAEAKRLIVDGQLHLHPSEVQRLLDLVRDRPADDAAAAAFRKAVGEVFAAASKLSPREKIGVLLTGDPARAGVILEDQRGSSDYQRMGEIDVYRSLVEQLETRVAAADVSFEFDHATYLQKKTQEKRAEVVGPVKQVFTDVQSRAMTLLEPGQFARGPVPQPWTQLRQADLATMYGLTIVGALLIAGLATRFASLGGATLLLMFYLAYPPLPGYPDPPGVEHAVVVNKNFIEFLILLAFVALPSGRWFGLDAFLSWLFQGKARRSK